MIRGGRPAQQLARSVWQSTLVETWQWGFDVQRRVLLFFAHPPWFPEHAWLDCSVADTGCCVLEHYTILWVACKQWQRGRLSTFCMAGQLFEATVGAASRRP